ncbi:MAG: D-alanine--D-alanine ligase [Flavobacteriales bacterium]|nr:D-alanine--D-alanine ligase [Flavobacteriales bacterium]MDG1780692.1 D-alanine--D-alanine ligase [Flavobacteriales bacterium]MDG2244901.1 D-alanine--D-alanine ligase [Flavobacteriales bacterium]
MKRKNIAVLAGGFSGEAAISGNSGRMVMKNIDRDRYNPMLYWITSDGWHAEVNGERHAIDKNDFSTEIGGELFVPDFAFVMIHGTPGEDGIIQGYLELIGIPYSTGNALNMALTFHKGMTVSALRGMDIPVAKGVLLHTREGKTNEEILAITGLPCFVKPNQGGSSIGMSKVKAADELDEAIEIAFKEDKDVLIETFMEGTEVQCGVIPWNGELKALPLTEIVSHNEFFDYAAKYEGQSDEITPARISPELTAHVQSTAKMVYQATNCRGMIRIDFMIVEDIAHIIEINTVPGFSEASIIPQQAAAANISATALISSVIEATC